MNSRTTTTIFFVLFFISLIFMSLSQTYFILFIRNSLSIFTAPAKIILQTPAYISDSIHARSRTKKDIYSENILLQKKINENIKTLSELNKIKEENKKLRNALDIPENFLEGLILAETLVSDPEKYFAEININKGAKDGVQVDMPVVTLEDTERVLLGRINRVSKHSSTVLLITASGFRSAVSVDHTYGAILKGNNSWKVGLEYISPAADINENADIYTSGVGGIFPEGLYVGKVVKVSQHGAFSSKYATVDLAICPQDLKMFYIIKRK